MREDLWSVELLLKDMLFDSSLTYSEIAGRLNVSDQELHKLINKHGLGWIKKARRRVSRGQNALMHILKELFPNEAIVQEHHVGERLRLDLYIPSYQIGVEYHGRQHFHFSNLFHDTIDDFREGQRRDARKAQLCEEQGISLIVFRYNDKLSEDIVFDRVLEAIRSTPHVEKEKKYPAFKGNPYYERMKQRNREYRREQYRRYKNRGN